MLRMMVFLCALLVGVAARAQDPCLRPDSYNMLYCAGKKAQEQAEERQRRERQQQQQRQPGAPQAPPVIVGPAPAPAAPPPKPMTEAERDAMRRAATEQMLRAILAGDEKAAREQLVAGADSEVILPLGISTLMLAGQRGHVALVERLLLSRQRSRGGHFLVDWVDASGNNAVLHVAADGPAPALAVLLRVANQEEVQRCNADGWSAMSLAAALGRSAAVQALLAPGFHPDNDCAGKGELPLLAAVAGGHADIVAMLLNRRADPTLRGRAGLTPMQMLDAKPAQEQLRRSAAVALDRMRQDRARATASVRPATEQVAAPANVPAPGPGARERIASLLQAPLASRRLLEAARSGDLDAARAALAAGADVRFAGSAAETPLIVAARSSIDIVRLLLPRLALSETSSRDMSQLSMALSGAAYAGQTETVALLLSQPGAHTLTETITWVIGRLDGRGEQPMVAQMLRQALEKAAPRR